MGGPAERHGVGNRLATKAASRSSGAFRIVTVRCLVNNGRLVNEANVFLQVDIVKECTVVTNIGWLENSLSRNIRETIRENV